MSRVINIMAVGVFSASALQKLSSNADINITVESKFSLDSALPDVLLLEFNTSYPSALQTLLSIPIESRPILIAVLPSEDSQILRAAMHAGARDYLLQPLDEDSLLSTIHGFLQESVTKQEKATGKITAVISANSSAESAFISGNLSQIMAGVGKKKTTLIDFDLQFSNLPLMLDIVLERSLLQSLEVIETLDEIAIGAYLAKHKSGLKVLGSLSNEIAIPGEVSVEKARRLVRINSHASDHVFINLPTLIDPLASQLMGDADQIIICVDQSFSCLNYSKGLLNVLLNELDIPAQKIRLLINHYQKNNQISQKDIEKALSFKSSLVIPADTAHSYAAERYSLLLYETANQSTASRSLIALAESLNGSKFNEGKGLFSRLFTKTGSKSS
jgi:pilus assembly protein CpaE